MNRKQRSQNRIPIVPFRTPPASSESSATEIIMKKKGGDFNECMQAKTDLNENNQDLRVAAYTATLTTMGHGWTNSTMTETGLSQLHHECQKLDGRLTVVDTAVVKCNHDSADATWSAYTNVGDCFPNIPACEPYTVASFFTNMSTSSSDLGSILGSCQIISDVPRTTYIPEVLAAPTTSSVFGPAVPTSPHSDVPRGDCMESQQTYFTGSHKLDDNVIMAYVNSKDLTFGKGVSIQSYGIDEQTAYRNECEAKCHDGNGTRSYYAIIWRKASRKVPRSSSTGEHRQLQLGSKVRLLPFHTYSCPSPVTKTNLFPAVRPKYQS
jgi:hypothetical protein